MRDRPPDTRDSDGEPGTRTAGGEHGSFLPSDYFGLVETVSPRLVAEDRHLERQRASAAGLLSDLEPLDPVQRKLVIRNSPQYRIWPLIEKALVRSQALWSEEPDRAEEMATQALEVSETLEASGFRARLLHDAKAEIWSFIGNCRRIRSDLFAAHQAYATGEKHLALGTGDPLERARFLDLKSSLWRAQRDFEQARLCIEEAVGIYRDQSDSYAEGRVLLKLGILLGESGRPQEAVETLQRAGRLVDLDHEPRLELLVKWNLIVYLREAERLDEARDLLPEVRDLARAYGTRLDRLRVLWAEALLRKALGQVEFAESALSQVREGFLAAGIGYSVALVSLDLAAVYLESGRNEDARRLAVETVPFFLSRNVRRELLAAWQLFRDAAERDVATLALITDVAAQVRQTESAGAPHPAA